MRIYAGDYDGNGRLDAIGTYYLNGVEYPIASRDELSRQLPVIKKQFTNYARYAKARLTDLLSPDQQQASTVFRACWQKSILLENTGSGFQMKPLPALAQWAPIQSLLVVDIDRDGNLDVLAIGNAHDTESIAGQYDAMTGLVLKGDGKGRFRPLLFPQSGFLANGDGKSIVGIMVSARRLIVTSANKGPLTVFDSSNK